MHTKGLSRRSSRRRKTVSFSVESLKTTEDPVFDSPKRTAKGNYDDTWIEEDEVKREHPLIRRLSSSINAVLTRNPDVFLSFCPNLPRRIADEVARVSRDEPGGVAAGRIKLNLGAKEGLTNAAASFSEPSNESTAFFLGTTSLSDKRMVETFEIDVYLFPSDSVLSKLHSIISNLSLTRPKKPNRFRNISLLPDFILIKRKLFRSNKPLVIVKSLAK